MRTSDRVRPVRRLAPAIVLATCLGGLAGCITPLTYSEVHSHVYEWSPVQVDRQFPLGTPKKAVFAKLGDPSKEIAADGLLRWDYDGGKSSHQSVTFIFRNDRLAGKQ
jgi:hypothetical protein